MIPAGGGALRGKESLGLPHVVFLTQDWHVASYHLISLGFLTAIGSQGRE